jgi:hypothetical protein
MTDGPEFIPTPEERRRNREIARHGAPPLNQGKAGGPPPQYPGRQNWWFRRSTKSQFGIVIACAVGLFVVIGVIGAIADKNDGGSGNNSAAPTTTAALEHATAAPEQSEPTAPAEPSETPGQQNARDSAQSYLETSAFSRSGLIKQLKYEGYSLADATYAVGAITVNWKEQAAKAAQSYLETSAFSRSGLIKQLKYEGYSLADATYAVGAITVNWNEQAARSAQSYLETSSFSRSGLIEQLEYEGFTPAQATYGVNAAY